MAAAREPNGDGLMSDIRGFLVQITPESGHICTKNGRTRDSLSPTT